VDSLDSRDPVATAPGTAPEADAAAPAAASAEPGLPAHPVVDAQGTGAYGPAGDAPATYPDPHSAPYAEPGPGADPATAQGSPTPVTVHGVHDLAAPPLRDALVGSLLDGRYRVEARVAVGGMATVYRAVDTRLDRVVALKVMHPGLASDAAFAERFTREAKAVARLTHPNVVGVFDQGTDGPYVYLAMEFVPGRTLRDLLRERGALTPHDALTVLDPVLAALGAAHRAGLVHRDVKPENVLLGDDGRVKVADFGLVRALDATGWSAGSSAVTTPGSVLGTASYMAPEQITEGRSDTRTDVYACGIMLYELLTGLKPYPGGSPVEVIYQHLNEDVPRPSAAAPAVSPELDALVAAATARDPELRPVDANALLARLRTVRDGAAATHTALARPATAPDPGTVDLGGVGAGTVDLGAGSTGVGLVGADPLGAGAGLAGTGLPGTGLPGADPHADAEPTTVLPPVTAADQLNPTAVFHLGPPTSTGTAAAHPGTAADAHGPGDPHTPAPAPASAPGHRRRGPGRGVIAVLVALLLIAGTGVGVWYATDARYTRTPGVLDLTTARARARLDSAGLKAKVAYAHSQTVAKGKVVATDPRPGSRVRKHSTVTLTVSEGPRRAKVPNVVGKSLSAAEHALRGAGLDPGTITRKFSDELPAGLVLATDPAAGTVRAPGANIALTVSKGEPIQAPDVTGESVSDAEQDLQDAGLKAKVATARVYSSDADAGDVATQSPASGAQLAAGGTVTLTLSKGPQMVTVPDVTGKKVDDAKKILGAAGFKTRVIRFFFTGRVDSEDPDAGGQAPKGSTITLWVR
jgi:serine/threonine-protein kinase